MLCACLGGMIKGPLKGILLELEMSQQVFERTGLKSDFSLGIRICQDGAEVQSEHLQQETLQALKGTQLDHQLPAEAGIEAAT